MADIREARASTVSRHDLGEVEDFWPQFVLRLEGPKPGKPIGLGWSWAVGIAGLLALTIVGLFFLSPSPPQEVLSSGVKLRINYVRMYEEPGQAFIFHTQDANSTFVWVEKQKTGEVL